MLVKQRPRIIAYGRVNYFVDKERTDQLTYKNIHQCINEYRNLYLKNFKQ